MKKRPPGEEITEIFMKEKQEADKKVAELKTAREKRELEDCTFRPNIFTRTASQSKFLRRHSVFTRNDENAIKVRNNKGNYSVQDEKIIFW